MIIALDASCVRMKLIERQMNFAATPDAMSNRMVLSYRAEANAVVSGYDSDLLSEDTGCHDAGLVQSMVLIWRHWDLEADIDR